MHGYIDVDFYTGEDVYVPVQRLDGTYAENDTETKEGGKENE